MALWLVRAGKHGESEKQFIDSGRIYLQWTQLADLDLAKVESADDVLAILEKENPGENANRLANWSRQIAAFLFYMKEGDWVILPLKNKPAIAVGEVQSGRKYDPLGDEHLRHYRDIKWLNTDVPRSVFDQDLLHSFGAFLTVCQITRNDAEARVRRLAEGGWKHETLFVPAKGKGVVDVSEEGDGFKDYERLARDQMAKWIIRRFKGFEMARLVEAILKAQGYITYLSPKGPDKGIDILAASGPMGFGETKICVQVKSSESPIEREVLDQLMGVMHKVKASQGLLVSWGGFKESIEKEKPSQFFNVRLWDQDDLINELLNSYPKIDEEIRSEIPLKCFWTLTLPQEEV